MRASNHHAPYFSGMFQEDLLNVSTGRRSRRQSMALADHYQSHGGSVERMEAEGVGLMGNLFQAAQSEISAAFQKRFMFGVELSIWRKGNIKKCVFFLDQHLQSFLWASTPTKAFLFDLSFTTLHRFDFELEKTSELKDYFILRYFEEELPVVFEGDRARERQSEFYQLFNSYIVYCKIMDVHPSYFSKILKKSIIEDIKDDVVRSKQARDILKVTSDISWNSPIYNDSVMSFILTQKGPGHTMDSLLTPEQINDYFKISSCCQSVKDVFQRYANAKLQNFRDYLQPMMPKQAFLQFLIKQQNEPRDFIQEMNKDLRQYISFYDFSLYLLNEKNNYASLDEYVDENLPLTDYFCYSSHNTYLSGNQLTSDSKISRYLADLDDGLKCVELDVHNDGDRPIITHAFKDKSLCKPIDFQQTIQSISKFCSNHQNHYPIILSIENHANQGNKVKMFNMILKAFGKKLLLVSSEVELEELKVCRTLGQLKGRVIVKTDSKINEIKPFKKTNSLHNNAPVYSEQVKLSSFMKTNRFPCADFSQKYHQFKDFEKRGTTRKQQFVLQFHRELYLPLQEMTKITGIFKAPEGIETVGSTAYECTSLTNEKAMKAKYSFITDYTKRSWLRIYPVATQISSNNYNPVPMLRIGAQIIALNTQTKDYPALMLMSYFTGGRELIPSKIGYIPKPPHLRTGFNPEPPRIITTYSIRLFSNQKINIRLFGSEQDMQANSNSILSFKVVDSLEAFLVFEIGEEYKDCIPLRFLRSGYRVLVAKNKAFRDSGKRVLFYTGIQSAQLP